MLNVFPIQFLAPLAYAILRVCVALVFLYLARKHSHHKETLTVAYQNAHIPYPRFFVSQMVVVELVIGVLFFVGLYTQIAALLSMLFILKLTLLRKLLVHPLLPSTLSRVLLFFASLSLFITGAGVFAFDLPI